MKQIFLLPIAFTLLTACQEPSKVELKPFVPPPELQKTERLYEGPSGLVFVHLSAPESEEPVLPSQIKISFELSNSANDNLSLANRPFNEILLFSKNVETVYYGCEENAVEVTLPQTIDALRVVLCGKINVPALDFKLRASFLELRNAELTTVNVVQHPAPNQSRMLEVSAANLTVIGTNKFILQGNTNGRDRERAPNLKLGLARTWGAGTFEIFSRSSAQYETY